MPMRLAPVEPSAPHLMSASIAFLLTVRLSTRAQKSHSDVNGRPLGRPGWAGSESPRARLIASTAW